MNAHRPSAFVGLLAVLLAARSATAELPQDPAATNAPTVGLTLTNSAAPVVSAPAKTNTTEITSKQLRMDTEKKVAHFDGDVQVIDPQFLLRANRLIVFLNPNGSGMERAEAYEDVVIVQESSKRRATSQKAVYTPADGKMVLTGNPRLEDEKGVTRGEIITIFRNNNTILIEGGTRTTLDLSTPSPTSEPPSEATTADTPKPGSN